MLTYQLSFSWQVDFWLSSALVASCTDVCMHRLLCVLASVLWVELQFDHLQHNAATSAAAVGLVSVQLARL